MKALFGFIDKTTQKMAKILTYYYDIIQLIAEIGNSSSK